MRHAKYALLAVTALMALVAIMHGPADAQVAPTAGVYRDQGGDRLTVASGGTLRTLSGCALTTTDGVGTVVSTTGLTVTEYGIGPIHRTQFTLSSSFDMKIVDSGANGGHAGVKIYDFPEGYLQLIGAEANLDFSAGTNGLTSTSTYDVGVGTADVGTDNAALATTEQDVIAKVEGNTTDGGTTTIATLHGAGTTITAYDGTATAKDLYINAAIEADDCSATQTANINGTVTVYWINLGDH